jgi:hypothetical protein
MAYRLSGRTSPAAETHREPHYLFVRAFRTGRAAIPLARLLAGRGANWTSVINSGERERMGRLRWIVLPTVGLCTVLAGNASQRLSYLCRLPLMEAYPKSDGARIVAPRCTNEREDLGNLHIGNHVRASGHSLARRSINCGVTVSTFDQQTSQ